MTGLVSQDTIREVSDATLHFYRTGTFPPSISPQARSLLDERFAVLDAEDKLHGFGISPKQQLVANTVLDHYDKRSTPAKLKALGVDTQVYQLWLRDARFQAYMQSESERRLQAASLDTNTALIHKATQGDTNALKFYYELTGRFNAHDQALGQTVQSLQVTIQILMELIQKYMEPAQMLLLAAELETRTNSARDNLDVHAELKSETTPARFPLEQVQVPPVEKDRKGRKPNIPVTSISPVFPPAPGFLTAKQVLGEIGIDLDASEGNSQ